MPNVLAGYLGYFIFFWSNEMSGKGLEPIHVHISKGHNANATKIWITRTGIALANNNDRIPDTDLQKLMNYILANRAEIIARWYGHFGEGTAKG